MANGVSRSTNPPGAVVIEPRVFAVGGAVALVGMLVVGAFLWMVPNAASREVRAACMSLRPSEPNPALCRDSTRPCQFPLPAPDFTAYDHDNRPVHLSDFRGKVVLVNFWASWCGVCKTEKPQLHGMSEDLASDDFVVIALASDRSWSDVLLAIVDAIAPEVKLPDGKEVAMSQALALYQHALPSGLPFEVFLDRPAGDDNIGQIAASWGIKAVPESALIDRQGNIRAYFVNKRDWDSPVAETCLRSLIDEE
jgi:thiol-disulfide isomerase/thioredoxin